MLRVLAMGWTLLAGVHVAGVRAFPAPRAFLDMAIERANREAPPLESAPLPRIMDYSEFQSSYYPHKLTRDEIQELVQRFVDEKHGKAFRYLGDNQDFDHGHFLFKDKASDRPFAVLFHTQERASRWSKEDPGGKYDYVDRDGRNWIVWLDAKKPVANARDYERKTYPGTPEWDEWVRFYLDDYRGAYTIVYNMLDPGKLGMDPDLGYPNERLSDQFTFVRVDCARLPDPLPTDKGLIEVLLPAASGAKRERACLRLGRDYD